MVAVVVPLVVVSGILILSAMPGPRAKPVRPNGLGPPPQPAAMIRGSNDPRGRGFARPDSKANAQAEQRLIVRRDRNDSNRAPAARAARADSAVRWKSSGFRR